MSQENTNPQSQVQQIAKQIQPNLPSTMEGVTIRQNPLESPEQKVDEIEMIGEEVAAGYHPPATSEVNAGIRYLHCSRTIHQLVTDRNRAVGLYLAVATLLWTASTALLNAHTTADLIIPLDAIKKWCLPITFAIMAVLAWLVAFLLIRTRIGLIYEVAKMNVLLGLPIGRVKRINPLSIFFLMHLIISLAGGGSAGLFALFMFRLAGYELSSLAAPATIIAVVIATGLILLYIFSVKWITSDEKLEGNVKN